MKIDEKPKKWGPKEKIGIINMIVKEKRDYGRMRKKLFQQRKEIVKVKSFSDIITQMKRKDVLETDWPTKICFICSEFCLTKHIR